MTCNAVVKSFGAERAKTRCLAPRHRPNGACGSARTWMRGMLKLSPQLSCCYLAGRHHRHGALLCGWHGQATPGEVAYVLTAYLVIHGYLTISACTPQPPALGQRHGGTGRHPCDALRHRGCAGARPIASTEAASSSTTSTFHYGGPYARRSTTDLSVHHQRRRTGRAGRAVRLRQDHLRQADPAPLRRQRRAHPDRRPGHRAGDAGVPASARSPSCSRNRSCSTARWPRTSPMRRPGRPGGGRAGRAPRQRP